MFNIDTLRNKAIQHVKTYEDYDLLSQEEIKELILDYIKLYSDLYFNEI